MKKLLISGVSSFIGFHLANFFSNYYKVYGTITSRINNYNHIQAIRLNNLNNKISFIENFNLTNNKMVSTTITNIKPDFFIHNAGWTKLYGSFEYDLKKGFEINVNPLSILFSSLKKNKCKGIILTGSSFEYSDGDSSDKETDLCLPTMPYGFSKLSQSVYAKQLSDYYDFPTRIARVYIPFGPFDSPTKLIPYIFKNLYNNQLAKLSSCKQKRDFIYIDDLIKMYEFLISDLMQGNFEIYNCASGKALKLMSLVNLITEVMGKSSNLLVFSKKKMRYGEANCSFANVSKLNKKYNNVLKLDINYGLKKYFEFLKNISV